jgi:uncharacterized protein YecE (DUF72 family)
MHCELYHGLKANGLGILSPTMLYLGTSGWSYKHWNKGFYPPGLPPREQLTYLARHFSSVELNASFYRLPPESSFTKWYGDTLAGFAFAIKVPRVITHLKRLQEVSDDWQVLQERTRPLGEKLSVYLAQFPPSFRADEETMARMSTFLDLAQASRVRLALELRHASWFEPEALAVFERRRVCVVAAESARYPHTPAGFAPANYTYYRLHGPRELYSSQYTDEELGYWAGLIRADRAAGRDVYVYFDNDVNGYALEDAQRLRALLEG